MSSESGKPAQDEQAAAPGRDSTSSVQRSEILLQTVTTCVSDILVAEAVRPALPAALEAVARVVRIDRMIVIEAMRGGRTSVYFAWQSPEAPAGVDFEAALTASPQPAAILEWQRPLREGKVVIAHQSSTSAPVLELMRRLGVVSALLVPIFVHGAYWGAIALEDCHSEHDWSASETNVLKILADLVGVAITRERSLEELRKANTIVQNSPTILYRLGGEPAFNMLYISQNVTLLGYEREELLANPGLHHDWIHPDDRPKVQGALRRLTAAQAPAATIEFRMATRSGQSRYMQSRYTPVRDPDGQLLEVEGIMVDITERKDAEERIARLARTDALTSLANRASFNEHIGHSCNEAQRGGPPFAVLYLDLDGFKEVNDTRGHVVGDRLLQTVAARLRGVAPEPDAVGRLGGDEFAVLQPAVSDPAISGALAGRIIQALSAPYFIDGREVRIGASVGITLYSAQHGDPDALLAQADQALYRAKEEGRNQYRFHSDELERRTREWVEMAEELRQALENGQLELFYQAQVELASGKVLGMEALLRWNHRTRGRLLPEAFLPVAERGGLMQALGRWVLGRACRQLAAWREQRLEVPLIAVNVALGHLREGSQFVSDVVAALQRSGLTGADLELDVTEFILARLTLAHSNVLEELRRLGVSIAIDDFGGQYSSLDYLRTYQVRRLKMARHVVAAIDAHSSGAAMIRAIVAMAAELGIDVVAQGIESETQRAALAQLGSPTKGQGFVFSEPMPADEATAMLRRPTAP